MDNQDQGKNHSSGHESRVVQLCHKCGWPFPNPHPSAKHRRAHKKICGTIEGYKLLHSGDIKHTTASDDEPLSDEDHKTPIAQVTKVMETCSVEKSIGGIGAISNRSKDDVFSDAAVEFQDSEFPLGRQDCSGNASKADKIAEKDLTANNSFKDCKANGILQPPRHSTDRRQEENLVLKSMPILSMVLPEHQDLGLSYSKYSEDRNGSASDMVLPSEHACEISETVSVSEKGLDVTLDMVLTDNIVQLKEEFSDRLASKTSMSENGEQETDAEGNRGINLERNIMDFVASNSENASVPSEKTEDKTSESGLADKIVELEENGAKFVLNMAVDDFFSKVGSAKDMDAPMDTFQMQTSTSLISNEVNDKKENENESVNVLSAPDDIPVVDNSEIKLEGFKDHKRVKLPLLEALVSEEIIVDKENKVIDCVAQEKLDTFQSNQLVEDIKIGSSFMLVEDSYKVGKNNEAMVKEVLVEGEADVLWIDKGSDVLGQIVEADTTENEKDQKVCSLEEQQPVHFPNDLWQTVVAGSMINVLPEVNPTVAHADIEAGKLDNEIGGDDVGFPERPRYGVSDIDEDNYVKNKVASPSCEFTNDSSLYQTNPASNLLEVDNYDDIGTRKTEKYDINVVECGDEQEEGYFSMEMNSTSECISSHHQSSIVGEEVSNKYVRTIPETEGPQFNRVSNGQDDIKKSEINGDNKVQGECAGEHLMGSALDNSGGNEFARTSEDRLKRELMHSSSFAEPTSQSCGAVDDSHTREAGDDASGISSTILQGEAENGSVKPQLDSPVVGISIESSSQTNLEGHWGSVSVLSTQSDDAAAINTEILPPTGSHAVSETEKANEKNSDVESEEQHFDKSDEFEPPSFMALVEPGGGDEKAAAAAAAAASEILTEQNAQDPKAAPLQAGWFPSLTRGANVSQGRKNNEEILAKVTNLDAKQCNPLMNLLGEANNETGPKSPNSKENPAAVKEKAAQDNGAMVTKVSSILGPESPLAEPTNTEARKEWDSPARYPADIKREKRKVKGRPLWVQFVCCSSEN